jgi:hypothetical protein
MAFSSVSGAAKKAEKPGSESRAHHIEGGPPCQGAAEKI